MRNSTFWDVFAEKSRLVRDFKTELMGTRLGAVLQNPVKDSKEERCDLTLQGSG